MALPSLDRWRRGPRTPCPIGGGLGEGQRRRARRRYLQSRAQAAGFQRVQLACRGIAWLIPKQASWPGRDPRRLCRRGTPLSGHFGHSGHRSGSIRDRASRCPSARAGWVTQARNDHGPRNRTMADKPRYYLTTAIAYPNGPPHIGHAYEAIATDAIARFMRLDGYDVLFVTGTDEHGIKMLQTAAKEKLTPPQLVERNVPRFKAMVERLDCSNDQFIRTTEERHHRASIAIWQQMEAAGDIYLGKYSGWYSVRDEAYYDEDETRLNDEGERVGPQGTPVEWVEEESYFFKLSAYQQKLLDLYARHPDFVLPKERLNEVMAFVKGGLQDLSISRTTFDWGVKVPANSKHVMYACVDAPRRIFSHGFLFNRGEKMSKSVGNVVDPFALVDAYGVDQVRYFFLREVPFGQDGNYSLEAIVNRINADLANDLGNLAQRSLTMIARQRGGVLPKPGAFSDADAAILAMADGMIAKAREAMKTQQLHQVLITVWAVVAEANRYFAGEAPWALARTDQARQGTVLYVTAEVIRQVAVLAQPFMPRSAAKLLDLLAVPAEERLFRELGGARRIAGGTPLPAPSPVFPRYVDSEGSAQS